MPSEPFFSIDLRCELIKNIDYQQNYKTHHFHLNDYQHKGIF